MIAATSRGEPNPLCVLRASAVQIDLSSRHASKCAFAIDTPLSMAPTIPKYP